MVSQDRLKVWSPRSRKALVSFRTGKKGDSGRVFRGQEYNGFPRPDYAGQPKQWEGDRSLFYTGMDWSGPGWNPTAAIQQEPGYVDPATMIDLKRWFDTPVLKVPPVEAVFNIPYGPSLQEKDVDRKVEEFTRRFDGPFSRSAKMLTPDFPCPNCGDTGVWKGSRDKDCPVCRGTGLATRPRPDNASASTRACPTCLGRGAGGATRAFDGRKELIRCATCDGRGWMEPEVVFPETPQRKAAPGVDRLIVLMEEE